MLTVETQPIFDRYQPQSQCEFYHMFDQEDKIVTSKNFLRLFHHSNESDPQLLVVLALSARKLFMKIATL